MAAETSGSLEMGALPGAVTDAAPLATTGATEAASAPDTTSGRRKPGMFAPLRRRNFALLFGGQTISALGDQAYGLALPWTVLAVTNDPRQVGIVLAAGAVPRVLLLLFGGALADRLSPRLVMIVADLVRVLVVGVLGVTLLHGLPPLWIVASLAGLEGAGSGLFQPGVMSLLPSTVSDDELPAGNGLFQVVQFLSLVLGPLLGGVATAAQASVAFLADAASFGVSALSLFGIRIPTSKHPTAAIAATAPVPATSGAPTKRSGIFGDIGAGFRYATSIPLLRTMMTITVFGNFAFAGTVNVALIVLSHALSPSPLIFALILCVTGVGGILGGLGSSLLGRLRRRGPLGMAIFVVVAALMVATPFTTGAASGLPVTLPIPADWHIPALAGMMGLIGLLLALSDTVFVTAMQQRIAPEYMARVFSIQFLMGGISQPLSLALAGLVAATLGPGVTFIAGGVVLLIALVIGFSSRELRNL